MLLIGTVGMMGMATAGTVLYLRDPGPFISIPEMLVFALSGAMYPISILTDGLQFLARVLPYTPTMEAVRSVVAHVTGRQQGRYRIFQFSQRHMGFSAT